MARRRHRLAILLLALASVGLAAQDKSAENMEILREEIKADKKLLVATNMTLTESVAKNFWPIDDEYQKNLQKINQRMANSLESCADDFLKKSLTVELVQTLTVHRNNQKRTNA